MIQQSRKVSDKIKQRITFSKTTRTSCSLKRKISTKKLIRKQWRGREKMNEKKTLSQGRKFCISLITSTMTTPKRVSSELTSDKICQFNLNAR